MTTALEGLLDRLQGANFVIGQSQRVQVMNQRAGKLARQADVLDIRKDQRLRFVNPSAQTAYRQALTAAFDPAAYGFGSVLIEPLEGATAQLSVLPLTMPLAQALAAQAQLALVSLRGQGEQTAVEENLLMSRYQLSKAEAAVVSRFASGATLADIATSRGVGYLAVRNQFSAAKQKMGVRRQTEILLKISELSPRLLLTQHSTEDSNLDG